MYIEFLFGNEMIEPILVVSLRLQKYKMKRLYVILTTMLGLMYSLSAIAQVELREEIQWTTSSEDHTPLWLNANKYGLSSLDKTNGYVRIGAFMPVERDEARRWSWGYGADVAVTEGFSSRFVVQQAYADVRWLKGVLTVGSKEQPMQLKNQLLSSGSQTFGINARPIPQVRLSLPESWQVPGLRGWLSLKGHIAYGMATDDGWQKDFSHDMTRRTEHTLYHSKAGYVKIGPGKINVEAGLEMATQFGGKTYNMEDAYGNKVIIKNKNNLSAFWHALIPGGTDPTDGSFVNTEGNHVGSWVMRLNIDQPTWDLGIYADQFFEDHSQMFHFSYNGYGQGTEKDVHKKSRYFLYDFKDWMLGVELHLKETPWLQRIVLEYLYTKYQGGPVYHDHTANINEQISGCDNYYNHNIFTGWQHWGQVMGNPLYRSPLYNDNGEIRVLNNRFFAWHLGLSGKVVKRLDYRLLATWQKGYGCYNYLLPDPAENVSMLAEAGYRFPENSIMKGCTLKGAFSFDSGKIYGDNVGVQLTLSHRGWLNIKNK